MVSAGLFQRELSVSTATQVAGRAVFAGVGLLGYVALTERGDVVHAFRAIGRGGIAISAVALASGSFLVALNHASVANVLFFQALAPILAAAMGLLLGDPVSRRTWVAMAIAVAGVAVMVGGPGRPSSSARDCPSRGRLVRGHVGHHPAPARRVDGAGDVPVAATGARVAAPFAARARPERST